MQRPAEVTSFFLTISSNKYVILLLINMFLLFLGTLVNAHAPVGSCLCRFRVLPLRGILELIRGHHDCAPRWRARAALQFSFHVRRQAGARASRRSRARTL